jgi:hypothetical protein
MPRRTFNRWIAELEQLCKKQIHEPERESFREVFAAGETPQSVIDEWGAPPVLH